MEQRLAAAANKPLCSSPLAILSVSRSLQSLPLMEAEEDVPAGKALNGLPSSRWSFLRSGSSVGLLVPLSGDGRLCSACVRRTKTL